MIGPRWFNNLRRPGVNARDVEHIYSSEFLHKREPAAMNTDGLVTLGIGTGDRLIGESIAAIFCTDWVCLKLSKLRAGQHIRVVTTAPPSTFSIVRGTISMNKYRK